MFRALTCPSSGGKIAFTQHLVSSLSVNGCTVHRLRADSAESGEEKNSFLLLGFELRTVQPVAWFVYGYIIIMDVSAFMFIMTDIERLNSQYTRHLVVFYVSGSNTVTCQSNTILLT
jgi:hypothetical protein